MVTSCSTPDVGVFCPDDNCKDTSCQRQYNLLNEINYPDPRPIPDELILRLSEARRNLQCSAWRRQRRIFLPVFSGGTTASAASCLGACRRNSGYRTRGRGLRLRLRRHLRPHWILITCWSAKRCSNRRRSRR